MSGTNGLSDGSSIGPQHTWKLFRQLLFSFLHPLIHCVQYSLIGHLCLTAPLLMPRGRVTDVNLPFAAKIPEFRANKLGTVVGD